MLTCPLMVGVWYLFSQLLKLEAITSIETCVLANVVEIKLGSAERNRL